MFALRCTVRGCCEILQHSDRGLTCAAGHHFDRAKQGYWSLLQPQDRKSKNPGDSEDAVMARHRWLERGHAAGLIEAIRPWLHEHRTDIGESSFRAMDLGCGEGTFGPALFGDDPGGYCGIDLSRRAIRLAARRWPQATWVLANADRGLPAVDESVDQIVSFFGRRPEAEIKRVLKPSGICIVAVPGEDDLIELREQAQQTGRRRSRWETVVDEFGAAGMKLVRHITWREQVELDRDAIADAMAMSYRAVRRSQQSRLETIDSATVTLSADIVLVASGAIPSG